MMKNKYIKKIGLITATLCLSITAPNVYAEESTEQAVVAETQTEAPAPQTEAPPPQTEPPAPQTEAPPPQTEAPAPQTEAPAPQTEAPAPQTETTTPQTETQTPQTETQAPQTEIVTEVVTEGQTGQNVEADISEKATEKDSENVIEGETQGTQTEESTEKVTDGSVEFSNMDDTLKDQLSDNSIAGQIAAAREACPYKTNESLLSAQNIVSPKQKKDFRFTRIWKNIAILKKGAMVKEEKSVSSRTIGKTEGKTKCYIIADEGADWIYIESDDVRGFVQKEDLITGKPAELISNRDAESFCKIVQLIPSRDNKAYTYTDTTTKQVFVSKNYMIATKNTDIKEDITESSRTVGTLKANALAFFISDAENRYVFVESDDVRGFVKKEDFLTGNEAKTKVEKNGEFSFSMAEEIVSPEENKACYYSFASVRLKNDVSYKRKAVIEFAKQFVGNPYVWGGTSLTNGADCSGFVQSVYANFGYTLPRVAMAQSGYGTQIPVSDAEPGDLIFYATDGYVYHVSMYIGNGMTVQAHSSKDGIVIKDIGANAVWATKIL